MRFAEFKMPNGAPVAVHTEQVGAVLHRADEVTTIRVIGRPEDIHVQGTFSDVLEQIKGPIQGRGRIGR